MAKKYRVEKTSEGRVFVHAGGAYPMEFRNIDAVPPEFLPKKRQRAPYGLKMKTYKFLLSTASEPRYDKPGKPFTLAELKKMGITSKQLHAMLRNGFMYEKRYNLFEVI